ncbi:DNA transformation protein [Lewinella aquimaris]|uniref:DNA transformation protein n=1 Tax=Neolewinella aquimaris TaxID=1835722 RepID=A0A840E012_9BACT|nr:TfoX/Sxy family protein [Neolewinella aquimaris]MBB4078854.1 DNA transformation protein [Neolewinella aquimaris]
MAVSEDYIAYLYDQLSEIDEIRGKKMFGGYGFFQAGKMFAMVGQNTFRLKVDETNKQDFLERGMEPLRSASKKQVMPYYEVPAEVLEDRPTLVRWARKSIDIAHASGLKKK